MLMTNTMVGFRELGLRINEDEVDNQQIILGHLGIAAFGNGEVIVATLGEAGIPTTPFISNDFCAWRNRSLHKAAKRLRATIRDNGEPDTTTPLCACRAWSQAFAGGPQQQWRQ